jgi:hypothetical protein
MPYTILKKYFVLLSFLLSLNLAKAQLGKESWNWAFGCTCNLSFNFGNPVISMVDSMCAREGCASISDILTGQLLFFSDGSNVWDKNSHRMPNGYGMLGGYGTSTQAALIVPKPGSKNIYYLISCDQGGYYGGTPPYPNQGVHYSIIDMSLNNGLGDVVSGSKNILLTPPPTTEKLVGVKHCNGEDYWIITHSFNSNAFNSYLVTSSGIIATPVVSNVGTTQNNVSGNFFETAGYLKASPNGKKLACAVYGMQFLELFDFDNSNGIITSPIKITDKPKSFYPYGVSFSPDNSKLFISADDSIFTYACSSNLYEYNLKNWDSISIVSSKIHISFNESGATPSGALQLATNNKLYFSGDTYISLSVINNPNDTGANCNYQLDAAPTFPYGGIDVGLPNFIDANNLYTSQLYKTELCDFPSYTINAPLGSNYQWLNGDTTKNISISTFGNYWVSYLNAKGCKEVDTFNIIKIPPPLISIIKDTSVCSNALLFPIIINATDTNTFTYLWSDGFAFPIHTISNPGTYWIDYTLNNFCTTRDSFNYFIDSIPSINLGKDTGICSPSYTLFANSNETYLWNTGAISPYINANTSGNYWVIVTSPEGCKNVDTINITFYTPPSINILKDSFECGNTFVPLTVNATYANTNSYLWNNGFTSPVQIINNPGHYWVSYSFNHGCISKDSFDLAIYPYPDIDLGHDTTFCLGDLPLNVFNPNYAYIWSNGETTSNITVTHAGIYWVLVNNHGCLYTDTLIVSPEYKLLDFVMPNIVTPNNDNINDYIDFSIFQFSSLQFNVFNRWGHKVFESTDPTCIWKPTEEDGVYYYITQYLINCGTDTQSKNLKGFITIIR